MDIPKSIEFNGIKYSLMGKKRYYLSSSTTNKGRKGAKGLHVAIWEFFNKATVPKGFVIHHRDHNWLNNNPLNLICISRKAHAKEHAYFYQRFELKEHLAKIRPLASKWHRSEVGRLWHSNKAKKDWEKRRTDLT